MSSDNNHDKEALKQLVIDAISKQCISAAESADDTPADIRKLASALTMDINYNYQYLVED